MNSLDPNIEALEIAAAYLNPLLGDLVLFGGCAVGLLITDRARPPVRATIDVDMLADVATTGAHYQLEGRLRELGFTSSMDMICRWKKDRLVVDVIPDNSAIFAHASEWIGPAIRASVNTRLPSSTLIRHVSAPYMLAFKLSAFHDRGGGDYIHHDIEDIVNLIDGRPEIVEEVGNSDPRLREYLREELDDLLGRSDFLDAVPGHFRPERAEQARIELTFGRLRALAGI
jgi:hypothetical protein